MQTRGGAGAGRWLQRQRRLTRSAFSRAMFWARTFARALVDGRRNGVVSPLYPTFPLLHFCFFGSPDRGENIGEQAIGCRSYAHCFGGSGGRRRGFFLLLKLFVCVVCGHMVHVHCLTIFCRLYCAGLFSKGGRDFLVEFSTGAAACGVGFGMGGEDASGCPAAVWCGPREIV